jgi:Ni,Fe-hydrogenase I large subunit
MSRGLLLHWVQLEDGPLQADSARAASYRVLAPTEWNFHPQGALAEALRSGRLDAAQAGLAGSVLDPCIAFEVASPVPHA